MAKRLDLPKSSRCYDCKWRLSRLVLPLDAEEFNVPEGTELIEHVCILLEDDLGNVIVKECTKYEKEPAQTGFFKSNIFANQ